MRDAQGKTWDPAQYDKFKDERERPFYDLLSLIRTPIASILDLGCGTGALTRKLHDQLLAHKTVAIDSAATMLDKAKQHATSSLSFERHDIAHYETKERFDLVFSNAALQWVPDHPRLFPRIFSWVKSTGQVAIQMPCNFDHVSHVLAAEVAVDLFPDDFKPHHRFDHTLMLTDYAELLYQHGFHEMVCRIQVYGSLMPSGLDVIEWVKGTLMNFYRLRLNPHDYAHFEKAYAARMAEALGTQPYFYAFKRMLLWGRR